MVEISPQALVGDNVPYRHMRGEDIAMAPRILAIDDSPMMLKLVRDALTRGGYEVVTAESAKEALRLLDKTQVQLIVTDVMMPEMDGYELVRILRRRPDTAHLPILMLTAQDTLDAKVKGFEAGADDYLTKPFDPVELQVRVQVLLRRATAAVQPAETVEGKAIAVFSLRGGVGVSTVAANLAVALAQLWGTPTALVDLALTAGQSALLLNLSLRHTWADVADIPAEELDGEVIERVLLPHDSGVHVLAGPVRPEQAELVTAAHVEQALTLIKRRFHYVVLDLPHDFTETTLAGLDAAHEILLLLTPELAAVRAVAAALEAFRALDYPEDQIHLVQVWTFKRPGLPRQELEDALRHPIRWVVPYMAEAVVNAINRGQPLALGDPKSPVRAMFEDWAFALSKPEHRLHRPEHPTEVWRRLAKRMRARRRKMKKAK